MKRLYGILIALWLLAFTATPIFADSPIPRNAARWVQFPFHAMHGIALGLFYNVATAIAIAAIGAVLVALLPNQVRQVSETAQKSLGPSLGVGCLTSLAALPLLLLIVFIITIPVALTLPIAFAGAWIFGWIALGGLVGERVLVAVQGRESMRVPIIAMILGVLLLALVSVVPIVGWLIGLGVGMIGLGAVILSRFGTRVYPVTTLVAP